VSKAKTDWAFVYKCRLCGETERNPFLFADRFEVTEIMVDIRINGSHQTTGCGAIRRTSLHACKNGGVGVSDIQGVIQESISAEASSDSGN
jgi:hypothetical protein